MVIVLIIILDHSQSWKMWIRMSVTIQHPFSLTTTSWASSFRIIFWSKKSLNIAHKANCSCLAGMWFSHCQQDFFHSSIRTRHYLFSSDGNEDAITLGMSPPVNGSAPPPHNQCSRSTVVQWDSILSNDKYSSRHRDEDYFCSGFPSRCPLSVCDSLLACPRINRICYPLCCPLATSQAKSIMTHCYPANLVKPKSFWSKHRWGSWWVACLFQRNELLSTSRRTEPSLSNTNFLAWPLLHLTSNHHCPPIFLLSLPTNAHRIP